MEWKGTCFSAEKLYGMYTYKRPCRIRIQDNRLFLCSYWLRKFLFSCMLENILKIQEVKTLGKRYFQLFAKGEKGQESRVIFLGKRERESFQRWCRQTLAERFETL